jgi:pantoate kinase
MSFSSAISELQPAFASSIGQRLHAAMEEETTTVEHDLLDARLGCGLGDALADSCGSGRVRAQRTAPSLSRVEAAATVWPCASSMTWA